MACVEIGMWEVLDVAGRVQSGESRAAIERVTGQTRKAVRQCTALARELGWDPTGPEPEEALAAAVARRLRPVASDAAPGASEALTIAGATRARGSPLGDVDLRPMGAQPLSPVGKPTQPGLITWQQSRYLSCARR